jgi:hypothetical protein
VALVEGVVPVGQEVPVVSWAVVTGRPVPSAEDLVERALGEGLVAAVREEEGVEIINSSKTPFSKKGILNSFFLSHQ